MKKQPRRNLSVRVDLELFEQVQRIAEREQRTVSGQTCYWLRRAVWADQQRTAQDKSDDLPVVNSTK